MRSLMRRLGLVLGLLCCVPLGHAHAQPFSPLGYTGPISVTGTSAATALPTTTATGPLGVVITNTGSNTAYVALGSSTVVASTTNGVPLQAGDTIWLYASGRTHIAAVAATSTTTLYVAIGPGQYAAHATPRLGGTPACTAFGSSSGQCADGGTLPANVLNYGADRTGAGDSTVAFQNALLDSVGGVSRSVYVPCGIYHLTDKATIGSTNPATAQSQDIFGDGWCSIIDVSTDFNPAAARVFNIAVPTGANRGTQYSVHNMAFRFHQPPDATATTTLGQTAGDTTITVDAVPATAVVGSYLYNLTHASSFTHPPITPTTWTVATATTITNITGNVITLSQPVQGTNVQIGDTIAFAQPRANFKTLTQGCSLTPGSPGCKYPWAIYNNGANEVTFDHIMIYGGWDGIYQRGSSYRLNYVYGSVLDVLFDEDGSGNFTQLDNLMMWDQYGLLGLAGTAFPNGGHAFVINYYDDHTTCANLGANDGLAGGSIQCWRGALNITNNWSTGTIGRVMLDTAPMTIGNGTRLQIGLMQATHRNNTVPAISLTGSNIVTVDQLHSQATTADNAVGVGLVSVTGSGEFHVHGGYSKALETADVPHFSVSSGLLEVSNTEFDSGSGCGAMAATGTGYFRQSGTGVLVLNNDNFTSNCVASPRYGVVITADNAGNSISGMTNWNGWSLRGPSAGTYATGPAGIYQGPPPDRDRIVTTATDKMLLTDQQLDLNRSAGVTETMFGCSTNNNGMALAFYDMSGNASVTPHTLTPSGGTIMGAATYTMAGNNELLRFICDGANTDWKLR